MSDLGPWSLEVRADLMHTMADLLDDPNPIHLDPEAVSRLGLGDRVINQGPTNCGYVVSMLLDAYPGATIRSLRLRLVGQVRGGDRVVAGGRVESSERAGDGRLVRCAVWLDVERGARAVEGTATVELGEAS